MALIDKLPISKYFPMWIAFLGACKKLGNVKLQKLDFEHGVQVKEKSDANQCLRRDTSVSLINKGVKGRIQYKMQYMGVSDGGIINSLYLFGDVHGLSFSKKTKS